MSLVQLLAAVIFSVHGEGLTFAKKEISFSNGKELTVEIADTDDKRAQGLMYRSKLADGTGMLFVFPQEQMMSFWMKNTHIPLTIGFFDRKRILRETVDMEPPLGPVRDERLPHYYSKAPALFALEVPKGWFAKHKIKPGTSFSFKR